MLPGSTRKSLHLTVALLLSFSFFITTLCFGESRSVKTGAVTLIFSNNMAGDYLPCG